HTHDNTDVISAISPTISETASTESVSSSPVYQLYHNLSLDDNTHTICMTSFSVSMTSHELFMTSHPYIHRTQYIFLITTSPVISHPLLCDITPTVCVTSYALYITSHPPLMSSHYSTFDSTTSLYETTSSIQGNIYNVISAISPIISETASTESVSSSPEYQLYHNLSLDDNTHTI
ncbi:unnamed protein product, partial [Rangifer tarandus platyrhynchus]